MDEFSNILLLLICTKNICTTESTHVKNNIFFTVYSRFISGKEKCYLSSGLIMGGHDSS
jgi:hypothetical protein